MRLDLGRHWCSRTYRSRSTNGVASRKTCAGLNYIGIHIWETKMLVRLYCFLSTLKADKKGVSALEYALIAALIAAVIATTVTKLGNTMNAMFTNINSAI